MKIVIDVDDATGNLSVALDRPNVPPPALYWCLQKAAQAVFDPQPAAEQPRVAAAPAAALHKLPPVNGG